MESNFHHIDLRNGNRVGKRPLAQLRLFRFLVFSSILAAVQYNEGFEALNFWVKSIGLPGVDDEFCRVTDKHSAAKARFRTDNPINKLVKRSLFPNIILANVQINIELLCIVC